MSEAFEELEKNCFVCGWETIHEISHHQEIGNLQRHTCKTCGKRKIFFKNEQGKLVEINTTDTSVLYLTTTPQGSKKEILRLEDSF